MRTDYAFSALLGGVYLRGNAIFAPDGTTLLTPTSNRVSLYDLDSGSAKTLEFEAQKNIARLALCSKGELLLAVDVDGRAILYNVPRRKLVGTFHFKTKVRDAQFSPDRKYLVTTSGSHVLCWDAPEGTTREYRSLQFAGGFYGHKDDVVSISWRHDSRFLVTTSKDMTCRIWDISKVGTKRPPHIVLGGCRDTSMKAFWAKDGLTIYGISRDATLHTWRGSRITSSGENATRVQVAEQNDRDESNSSGMIEEQDPNADVSVPPDSKDKSLQRAGSDESPSQNPFDFKYKATGKKVFRQPQAWTVVSCDFSVVSGCLAIGFESGTFAMWELPDCNHLQSMKVGRHPLTSLQLNNTGDWVAIGSSKLQQFTVWEWQSECNILQQQGHLRELTCLAFTKDGQSIATGCEDGRVKVWNVASGFSYIAFSDHSDRVVATAFGKGGQVLFTASLDGNVMAYDMFRYRKFRTFTNPDLAALECLAVDQSAEVVCAGCMDTNQVFVWNTQTGVLTDVITGHEGPVSCLAFDPAGSLTLVTGSWDKSVAIWELSSADGSVKPVDRFTHKSEISAIAFRYGGKEFAAATTDGMITFWNIEAGKPCGIIEGHMDIIAGRKSTDLTSTLNKNLGGRFFTSLAYSSDGECILGGGESKYVCMYHVRERTLLRRFSVSENQSLDGVREMLNSKNMTQAGVPLDMLDVSDEEEDMELGRKRQPRFSKWRGPGSKEKDLGARHFVKPEIWVRQVQFSPSNLGFAAVTTEGLILFEVPRHDVFDPLDLDTDITPRSTLSALGSGEYKTALVMALRLGERDIIEKVFWGVPQTQITLVVSEIPSKYLERFLRFLNEELRRQTVKQRHARGPLEQLLTWVNMTLQLKWEVVERALANERAGDSMMGLEIRALHKWMRQWYQDLQMLCDANTFSLRHLLLHDKRGQECAGG